MNHLIKKVEIKVGGGVVFDTEIIHLNGKEEDCLLCYIGKRKYPKYLSLEDKSG